jgi:hypothetical protein
VSGCRVTLARQEGKIRDKLKGQNCRSLWPDRKEREGLSGWDMIISHYYLKRRKYKEQLIGQDYGSSLHSIWKRSGCSKQDHEFSPKSLADETRGLEPHSDHILLWTEYTAHKCRANFDKATEISGSRDQYGQLRRSNNG